MTRNVKLCIALLFALFLTFSVAIGVMAEPVDEPGDTSSEGETPAESSESSEPPVESSEESSESSEPSTVDPTDKYTVFVLGENVTVYINGSATPSRDVQVDPGSFVALRVVADEGYEVIGVSKSNGELLPGSGGIYTLLNVTSDCILEVHVIPSGGTSDPSDEPSDPSDSTDEPSDPSDSTDEPTDPMDEEVEIRVTIHGSGTVYVDGEAVTNDGTGTITEAVWIHVTDPSGKRVQFDISPAEGCRMMSLAYDGIPRELRSSFPLTITELTTLEVSFVSEEELPASFPVTVTVQTEGGYVTVNNQDVKYGPATTIDIEAGRMLNVWVYPEDGYEIDTLKVDGRSENISGGKYTQTSVNAAMNIEVSFKKKQEESKPAQAEDFSWTPNLDGHIVLNLKGKNVIAKNVFDRINTLSDADGTYVLLETEYVRWYVPCGQKIEGVTGDFQLTVSTEKNAPYYNTISDALQSAGLADAIFNFYQLTGELSFPEGTMVSFQLMGAASAYTGGKAELMVREAVDGKWQLNTAGTGEIVKDGDNVWTTPMEHRNSNYMVVLVQPGTEQPDPDSSAPESGDPGNEDSGEETPGKGSSDEGDSGEEESEGKSYAGLIVALIIAFVAVGGAATLFIVKWRQEKF